MRRSRPVFWWEEFQFASSVRQIFTAQSSAHIPRLSEMFSLNIKLGQSDTVIWWICPRTGCSRARNTAPHRCYPPWSSKVALQRLQPPWTSDNRQHPLRTSLTGRDYETATGNGCLGDLALVRCLLWVIRIWIQISTINNGIDGQT